VAAAAYVFGSAAQDILWAAVLGSLGGLGLQLLQEKGLELPHLNVEDDITFWNVGFVAPILVGALASVLVYTLNPPATGEILRFIGTALAAGIGGQAVLKSYVNGQIANLNATRAATAISSMQTLHDRLQSAAQAANAARVAGQPQAAMPPHADEVASHLSQTLQVDADPKRRLRRWQ